MPKDRLHSAQLCTATDQIGGICVPQFVRGEFAYWQIGKEGFILPTEAARCHIPAADRRNDVDACLAGLCEVCSEFIAIGDITHLAVLRALYGRIFALCHARDNPANGDNLFLLVDVTPTQPP